MLQPLCLGPSKATHPLQRVPACLQPLIAAANRGDDVAPIVDAIARSFGFDGFMYGVSLSLRPNSEGRQYVYTTWPPELTRVLRRERLHRGRSAYPRPPRQRGPSGLGPGDLSRAVDRR
jgi:hypothetical protein